MGFRIPPLAASVRLAVICARHEESHRGVGLLSQQDKMHNGHGMHLPGCGGRGECSAMCAVERRRDGDGSGGKGY